MDMLMRMNECDFTKRVYESTIEGSEGETTSEVDKQSGRVQACGYCIFLMTTMKM